jgi:ABC-2 type transport system ATP-binding protein
LQHIPCEPSTFIVRYGMAPVIVTHDVTRCFGSTTAVDHLTLEVNQGEIIGFLGHNGAGKTTTVRLLNGLLSPTSGMIQVLGLDPIRDGPQLRQQVGVLTEVPSLEAQLTGRECLSLYGRLYSLSSDQIQNQSDKLLADFNLLNRADERTATYSKGMRQRLALARALLHNPQLLYLDEPTSGLDPMATRQFHQTIISLSQEEAHTIILCTHNLNEAQLLCDKVAVLEQGRLIAYGPLDTLAANMIHGLKVEFEFDLESTSDSLADTQKLLNVPSKVVNHQTLEIRLKAKSDIPDIVHLLATKGARIVRVNPREPTLEDVYFALHEDKAVERLPQDEEL